MPALKVKSGFAILDVEQGRKRLKQLVDNGGRVPVIISGFVDAIYGNDDGVSREFCVTVTNIMVASDERA